MKTISVDFFGTLNNNSEFWKELLKFVILESIHVYVISGPWPEKIKTALEFLGFKQDIHYDGVYSILTHLSGKGLNVQFDENTDSWFTEEENWWAAKAEICRKVGSHIHFDSDMKFAKSFRAVPTRFIHTASDPGKTLIEEWHEELKSANTYDDWDEYTYMMTGMNAM